MKQLQEMVQKTTNQKLQRHSQLGCGYILLVKYDLAKTENCYIAVTSSPAEESLILIGSSCNIVAEKVQISNILQFLHGVQYCVWVGGNTNFQSAASKN